MASISCTGLECLDGTCVQRCYNACGGTDWTSAFQCDGSSTACVCQATTNSSAVVWASALGGACTLLCVVLFVKHWCDDCRTAERRPLVGVA